MTDGCTGIDLIYDPNEMGVPEIDVNTVATIPIKVIEDGPEPNLWTITVVTVEMEFSEGLIQFRYNELQKLTVLFLVTTTQSTVTSSTDTTSTMSSSSSTGTTPCDCSTVSTTCKIVTILYCTS